MHKSNLRQNGHDFYRIYNKEVKKVKYCRTLRNLDKNKSTLAYGVYPLMIFDKY